MASKDLSDLPDEFEKNPNKTSVPELIRNHQKYRFAQLYRLLESDRTITVVIPFNIKKGVHTLEHGLGKGLATGQWNNDSNSNDSIANLTSLVNKLFEKFPERVKYGAVGTREKESAINFASKVITPFIKANLKKKDMDKIIGYDETSMTLLEPSEKLYHVWGANVTNWNLNIGTLIEGGNQANGMGIQKPGIFGVITTPVYTNGSNIENISSPSNTDTIDPYEKKPSTYTNKILHIMKGWEKYLSVDSMKSLGTIINNSNEECSKCIYDNINDKTNEKDQIKEVVQILLDNKVIEKDDYMQDINAKQKYLKYKQKYLALKIYKNKL